jgi:hypothetical protein
MGAHRSSFLSNLSAPVGLKLPDRKSQRVKLTMPADALVSEGRSFDAESADRRRERHAQARPCRGRSLGPPAVSASTLITPTFWTVSSVRRPSRTWAVCRPLIWAADRVEHRESGMIRVAMTYRLSSPPRFWTVSCVPEGLFVSAGLRDELSPHADDSRPSVKRCNRTFLRQATMEFCRMTSDWKEIVRPRLCGDPN